MALTKLQVESLILFVEDYPVIWDKRLEEYKDTVAKEQAWNEVVKSLHPEEWVTWPMLSRDGAPGATIFRRKIVSKGRSGEGQMKKRPYVYTQQLQFLKAVMDIGPTSNNLQEVDSDATLVEFLSGTTNPPLEESMPVLEDRTSPPPRRRRRNRKR